MSKQYTKYWASENLESWRQHSVLQNAPYGAQSVSKGLLD